MSTPKPFPELKTERLLLRKVQSSDKHRVHYFRSDKEITKFIKRPQPQTLETAIVHIQKITEEFELNKSVSWGITLKDSPEMIGSICLWNFSEDRKTAEVGYDLDPKFQGKGIMREALKAVVDFGFQKMDFKTIEAYTDYRNIPSKRLLEQFGFIPSPDIKDPDNQDNVVYYLNY